MYSVIPETKPGHSGMPALFPSLLLPFYSELRKYGRRKKGTFQETAI